LNDPLTQVVFGENGAAVDSVMIGGRMVFRDGRLTTIDEAKLAASVEAANARLRNINAERRVAFSALDDAVGRFCVGLTQRAHPEQRYIEHFPIG
jgi:guanine deaminase